MRWPVIADFKYKDDKIDITVKLRIRAFEVVSSTCSTHPNFPQDKGANNCRFCGKQLDFKPLVMYAVYAKNEPYIDMIGILTRHTLLKWKALLYRIGQPSIIAYARTLDQAKNGLNWYKEMEGKDAGASFDIKEVTEDQLAQLLHQAKKEKIIKKI